MLKYIAHRVLEGVVLLSFIGVLWLLVTIISVI